MDTDARCGYAIGGSGWNAGHQRIVANLDLWRSDSRDLLEPVPVSKFRREARAAPG